MNFRYLTYWEEASGNQVTTFVLQYKLIDTKTGNQLMVRDIRWEIYRQDICLSE